MSHLQYSDYEGFGQRAREQTYYSQAVRIGDTIEISGQGGWDRLSPTPTIPTDLGKEVDQAFANVEHTLQEAGGKGWDQVYKVRGYVAPWKDELAGHIVRNLRRYCPNHQPLLTVVGVQSLAFEGMHVEIEVVAHLGKSGKI